MACPNTKIFKNSNGDVAVLRGNVLVLTSKNGTGEYCEHFFYPEECQENTSSSTAAAGPSPRSDQRARSRSLSFIKSEDGGDREFSVSPFPWEDDDVEATSPYAVRNIKSEMDYSEDRSLPAFSTDWDTRSETESVEILQSPGSGTDVDTEMEVYSSDETISEPSLSSLPENEALITPHIPEPSEELDLDPYFSLSPLTTISDLPEDDAEDDLKEARGGSRSLSPLTPPPEDGDDHLQGVTAPRSKKKSVRKVTRTRASQRIKMLSSTASPLARRHR